MTGVLASSGMCVPLTPAPSPAPQPVPTAPAPPAPGKGNSSNKSGPKLKVSLTEGLVAIGALVGAVLLARCVLRFRNIEIRVARVEVALAALGEVRVLDGDDGPARRPPRVLNRAPPPPGLRGRRVGEGDAASFI